MEPRQVQKLTGDERSEIEVTLSRGLARLGLANGSAPGEVVAAADQYVDREQVEREKFFKGLWLIFTRPAEPICEEIGVAWGAQVCRELQWDWSKISEGKEPEYAILAPARRFVIFPLRYVHRMLHPPYDDNTLLLTFNMLRAGKSPEAPEGALHDLTGCARHIIPKRDRPAYRK